MTLEKNGTKGVWWDRNVETRLVCKEERYGESQ